MFFAFPCFLTRSLWPMIFQHPLLERSLEVFQRRQLLCRLWEAHRAEISRTVLMQQCFHHLSSSCPLKVSKVNPNRHIRYPEVPSLVCLDIFMKSLNHSTPVLLFPIATHPSETVATCCNLREARLHLLCTLYALGTSAKVTTRNLTQHWQCKMQGLPRKVL